MAGSQLKKHAGKSASAPIFRHHCKDTRENMKHSNPNINTSMTHLNKSIHGIETGEDYTYKEVCDIYDQKIQEATDAGTKFLNGKKNKTVTLITFETYAPEGLPEDKYEEFFLKVANIQREIWGEENFIDGWIDYDEQHEYVDPQTREVRTSMVHMVSAIVPRLQENADPIKNKLSAFQVTKRGYLKRQINAITKMAREDYGVVYSLTDESDEENTVYEKDAEGNTVYETDESGNKRPVRRSKLKPSDPRTVEQLKAESRAVEAEMSAELYQAAAEAMMKASEAVGKAEADRKEKLIDSADIVREAFQDAEAMKREAQQQAEYITTKAKEESEEAQEENKRLTEENKNLESQNEMMMDFVSGYDKLKTHFEKIFDICDREGLLNHEAIQNVFNDTREILHSEQIKKFVRQKQRETVNKDLVRESVTPPNDLSL